MVLRYSINGGPYRLPPYSKVELEEMRLPSMIRLSATFRIAVRRSRSKTKSRQGCRRQIFSASGAALITSRHTPRKNSENFGGGSTTTPRLVLFGTSAVAQRYKSPP
jgi:hypothetical protein